MRKEELHASAGDSLLDTMNFLNEVTHRYPEAISFAPGRPYDGFFDTDQIFDHLHRYIDHLRSAGQSPERIRDALFQYGPTKGQICEIVGESLRQDEQIDVAPEAIVVTVGCQEATFLTLRALFASAGDVLLVSSPCYVGILGAARLLDLPATAVEGFDCADLEAAVEDETRRGRRPRALYVIPDHSNPSGATMSLENRRELLDLAARHDFLVLEDSPYRIVSAGRQVPSLKSLDHEGRVVHLGSFSKSLFPGLRVGFVVADQVVVDEAGNTSLLADEIAKIKSMVTVNTPSLTQAVAAGMLLSAGGSAGNLNTHTAAYYADSMRATLKRLDECFLADGSVHWNRPTGGFFLSLTVPFEVDNEALRRSAEDFGVIWTPMSYFYPAGGGERSLRLSVSYLTESDIEEGIARLARFVRAEEIRQRSKG